MLASDGMVIVVISVVIVAVFIVLFCVSRMFKIVQQGSVGVVKRLGGNAWVQSAERQRQALV